MKTTTINENVDAMLYGFSNHLDACLLALDKHTSDTGRWMCAPTAQEAREAGLIELRERGQHFLTPLGHRAGARRAARGRTLVRPNTPVRDAITIRHPWAWAIVHGDKRIENRGWRPKKHSLPLPIAIHSSQRPTGKAMRAIEATVEDFGNHGISVPKTWKQRPPDDMSPDALDAYFAWGSIVAVATILTLLDAPTPEHERWFVGPCGWVLCDVKPLLRPIPIKGTLGVWKLPPEVAADVNRQTNRLNYRDGEVVSRDE